MLPLIPQDKANHYVYGQVIFTLSTAASYLTPPGVSLRLSVCTGVGVVTIFAVGKEVWDKVSGKGTPDWRDSLWTMAGTILPISLLSLVF